VDYARYTRIIHRRPCCNLLLGPFHTDANYSRERSRCTVVLAWVFTLTRMRMFARTVRVVRSVKCNSREQLADEANFRLIFYTLIPEGRKLYLKSKIRWPEQRTFLDFRNFAMHTFTNRCSSASNSLTKFRRSYFSFREGLCLLVSSPWWDSSQNFTRNKKHHCSSCQKYSKPHYYLNLHLEVHQDTRGTVWSWSTRDVILIWESFHFRSEL